MSHWLNVYSEADLVAMDKEDEITRIREWDELLRIKQRLELALPHEEVYLGVPSELPFKADPETAITIHVRQDREAKLFKYYEDNPIRIGSKDVKVYFVRIPVHTAEEKPKEKKKFRCGFKAATKVEIRKRIEERQFDSYVSHQSRRLLKAVEDREERDVVLIYNQYLRVFPSDDLYDVNLPDPDGMTLFHFACRHRQLSMIISLLENPNLNVMTRLGGIEMTPLHEIMWRAEFMNRVRQNPRIKFDPNVRDNKHFTPLHCMAEMIETTTRQVTYILDIPGVDPNARTLSDDTPLSLAAYKGNQVVIDALLERPRVSLVSAFPGRRDGIFNALFEHNKYAKWTRATHLKIKLYLSHGARVCTLEGPEAAQVVYRGMMLEFMYAAYERSIRHTKKRFFVTKDAEEEDECSISLLDAKVFKRLLKCMV